MLAVLGADWICTKLEGILLLVYDNQQERFKQRRGIQNRVAIMDV
jgi:hypothetical protein